MNDTFYRTRKEKERYLYTSNYMNWIHRVHYVAEFNSKYFHSFIHSVKCWVPVNNVQFNWIFFSFQIKRKERKNEKFPSVVKCKCPKISSTNTPTEKKREINVLSTWIGRYFLFLHLTSLLWMISSPDFVEANFIQNIENGIAYLYEFFVSVFKENIHMQPPHTD